ncbi:MAG: hypothetical protein R3C53_18550 [Pirellulaceae bacterium]
MDLKKKRFRNLILACTLASTVGCVAPKTPVPTFWQKLGVPQAGARLRDGLVNRRGNFPGLEKKPPVLALADPANLDPSKPDMIKAAAEIKADQDLKKQKIKAIKFLAEVNCGCYNKDDKVEAAFLAALEDCDPDVRMAAVEGLDVAAGECSRCRTGCETTCCTEKLLKKLDDIANGMKDGCYKEPNEEIRKAARALICKCPPPAKPPIEPEELIAPDPVPKPKPVVPKPLVEGEESSDDDEKKEEVEAKEASYRLSDEYYGEYDISPVVVGVAHTKKVSKAAAETSFSLTDASTEEESGLVESQSTPGNGDNRIANPDQLVKSQVVTYRKQLGELLLHLPDAYEMDAGWTAIIVDEAGNHSLAKIIEVGGRRILLAIEKPQDVQIGEGQQIRMGLVSR